MQTAESVKVRRMFMKTVKSVQKAFFIVQIPMLTAIVIAVVCLLGVFITKTKL